VAQKIKATRDDVAKLRDALRLLGQREILVGFPEDTSARTLEPGDKKDITNAALGYIHDNGDPDAKIPARPFMREGMDEAVPAVTATLMRVAQQVVKRRSTMAVEQGLTQVGLKVQFALRRKINEGIPPPLALSTLQKRAAKGRKGAAKELENRAKGLPPSTLLAKPLIDTGQLRNAINFVIRPRKARKK
jgi:hypothetical protein